MRFCNSDNRIGFAMKDEYWGHAIHAFREVIGHTAEKIDDGFDAWLLGTE